MQDIYPTKSIKIVFLILISISFIIGPASGNNYSNYLDQNQQTTASKLGYIDVTVQEVWNMCSDTANGITLPIDVRTNPEWLESRINTSYPEFPRHFILSSLQSEHELQTFLNKYNGTDIIVYCKSGGRSAIAAQILIDNNFNGTVYNMLGGITAWIDAGLPIKVGNIQPDQPSKPAGTTVCSIGKPYTFETRGTDIDTDALRYGWDWNGDHNIDYWTEYFESGKTIESTYSWTNPGEYNISVIAEDIVGDQSIYSSSLLIKVSTPPSNPTINGPSKGKINEEQVFTISSSDADGDNVFYYIDWGDDTTTDWIGPYQESTLIDISHIWTEKATYAVRAKTKDINEIESDWTEFEIAMPKMPFDQKSAFKNILSMLNMILAEFHSNLPT